MLSPEGGSHSQTTVLSAQTAGSAEQAQPSAGAEESVGDEHRQECLGAGLGQAWVQGPPAQHPSSASSPSQSPAPFALVSFCAATRHLGNPPRGNRCVLNK